MHLNDGELTRALERVNIPKAAASFVTFSLERQYMKIWERSAAIELLTPDQHGKGGTVEANLQSLVRDFGACIVIPLPYGKDILNRYPQLLEDLWKFDNDLFPWLMIGVPTWLPFWGIKNGLASRNLLIEQIEGLFRRIDQYQRGKPVDFNADNSDLSDAALERNKIFNRDGWTFPERAVADLANLWAQNANTQPLLLWLLTYVYSTEGVAQILREEIAPYVKLLQSTPREIVGLNITGLTKKCQLLKACVFKTYRLVIEPTSIRYVARPVTISDGDFVHTLEKGTFVSAPRSLFSRDPSIFPDQKNSSQSAFWKPTHGLVNRSLDTGHSSHGVQELRYAKVTRSPRKRF